MRALRRCGVGLAMLLLAAVTPAEGAARLSDDGRVLILGDESGRQPAVVPSLNRETGAREIRLTGRAPVLSTLDLRCRGAHRTIPLASWETTAEGTRARYPDDIAQMALQSPGRATSRLSPAPGIVFERWVLELE